MNAVIPIRLGGQHYIKAEEFADRHGVSRQRVYQWIEGERIEGVRRIPGTNIHLIPSDASRPEDRRRDNPGRPRKN